MWRTLHSFENLSIALSCNGIAFQYFTFSVLSYFSGGRSSKRPCEIWEDFFHKSGQGIWTSGAQFLNDLMENRCFRINILKYATLIQLLQWTESPESVCLAKSRTILGLQWNCKMVFNNPVPKSSAIFNKQWLPRKERVKIQFRSHPPSTHW